MKDIEFELPNYTLRGFTNGNIDAPILLCLHGWLDNSASFQPLNQYLSDFHVIAIDLPGHGLSDHKSPDAYYHFIDWVSDLYTLCEQESWAQLNIVGHSMGAMIATAFAAAFPEKVKSIVLIDSIGFITNPADNTTQQLRDGITSRVNLQTKKLRHHTTEDSAISARQRVSDLSYNNAKLLTLRSLVQTDAGFIWRYDTKLQLISPYRLSEQQAKNLIHHIQSPCLLICGKSGADFVKKALDYYLPLFNDISCYHLVGGHHVHMEQPKDVAQMIQTFLK